MDEAKGSGTRWEPRYFLLASLTPVFLDLWREGESDRSGIGDFEFSRAVAAADDFALKRGAAERDGCGTFGACG
jgi:hypothetical protein